MENWRRTSSIEPVPLGRRNDKKILEVAKSSQDNKAPRFLPIIHVPQGVLGRPIDAAANNLLRKVVPSIQVNSKISRKEVGKMTWNLQQGMTAEEARAKLNFGKMTQLGHTESKTLENGDHKTEFKSKKTQSQSSTGTTKMFQVCNHTNIFHKNPNKVENEQQREVKARNTMMDVLHKFREYCKKLSDMKHSGRVDLTAAQMVKNEFGYNTDKQYLGSIPGVKVGDKFYYRMELHVLGLHRPPQSGIDTMEYKGEKIATSIVASGGYNNYTIDSNTLIYCGHGGYALGNQDRVEDQKLEGGNRALLNSKRVKNPVRVIKGRKERKDFNQCSRMYTYDGLYTVEDMWKIKDSIHHKIVFNFKLVKISGESWSQFKLAIFARLY